MRAGANVHSAKLLGRKQQAGACGCPQSAAESHGSGLSFQNPHVTFCSYCCFMDRKCWSHCLFTSSSCGARRGLAGDKQRSHEESQLHMDQLPKVRAMCANGGCRRCLNPSLLKDTTFLKAIHLYQPPHCIPARKVRLIPRHRNSTQLWNTHFFRGQFGTMD